MFSDRALHCLVSQKFGHIIAEWEHSLTRFLSLVHLKEDNHNSQHDNRS